jgi:hypothetical protein
MPSKTEPKDIQLSWTRLTCQKSPRPKGNSYFMETSGGGTWCGYFGIGRELKACRSDFAWQATQLEAGGEIAAEGKPTFDSSSNNAAEWTNYTWHTWASGAAVVTTAGLC